jgi:hypothetical protein
MARQDGVIPIRGKLDRIVFYKTSEGYLVKTKGSLDKKRVLKDPAFAGSRRASTAFKRAAEASGLLRRAMGLKALKCAETRMAGRLCGRMMQVVKTDRTDELMDQKLVERGNLELLRGFAWHRDKPVMSVLAVNFRVEMEKATGELRVVLPEFVPSEALGVGNSITHFEIICSGALLDFERGKYEGDYVSSGVLPMGGDAIGEMTLSCKVTAGSALPAVLGMGVVCYQEFGGEMVRMVEGGVFEVVGVLR